MSNTYFPIFRQIAQNMETLSESVMEYDHDKNDPKGEKTAEIMRQDYANLYDKLSNENLNVTDLSHAEWVKILVGVMVVTQNMEDQIKIKNKVINQYKIDIMPKLNRILNETKTDEEAATLANELFNI